MLVLRDATCWTCWEVCNGVVPALTVLHAWAGPAAGWAGLAVGDTAVGELVVLFLGVGAFFGRGLTLQVAGCEDFHGVCSDLYRKSIPLRFFGAFVR